jgi:hypothetical protein
LFFTAVALLTLHPMVVECLSSARGYGMALAFWMWALDFLLVGGRLELAGAALGLSAAAHLAFAFPAIGLGAAFSWTNREKRTQVLQRLAIPAVVTAFIVLALPLAHVDAASFAAGSRVLVRGWSLAAIPLVLAALFVRGPRLLGGTMALTFLLLIAAKHWLRLPYPSGTATVYWVPMITLAALGLVDKLARPRLAAIAGAAVAIFYLWQFPIRKPQPGVRELMKAVRQEAPAKPTMVGASESIAPIVAFYKDRYRLWYWTVSEEKSWDNNFDYYFLRAEDARIVESRHLYVVARSSGMTAAR